MDEYITGAPLGPRVTSVRAENNYTLIVTFNNDEVREFDAKPLLDVPAFGKLKNPGFFKNVRVAYGTVTWDDDIDYCPDCLYNDSVPLN